MKPHPYIFFALQFLNTLHAEIIYTSPFINAEIKIICLKSKWQALLGLANSLICKGNMKQGWTSSSKLLITAR